MRIRNTPTMFISKAGATRAAAEAFDAVTGADRYVVTRQRTRDCEGGASIGWTVSFLDRNNLFVDHLIVEE
jgi:hypothetical protein